MTRVDDQPRESTKCWRQSRKLCPKLDNVIIKCLTMFHSPLSPSSTPPAFTLYTCFLVSFFSYAILQLFLSMHFSFFPLGNFSHANVKGGKAMLPLPPSSLCLFVDLSGSSSISNYKIIISSCSIDKFPICFSSCRFQFRLIEFYFLLLFFFLWLIKIILFTLY